MTLRGIILTVVALLVLALAGAVALQSHRLSVTESELERTVDERDAAEATSETYESRAETDRQVRSMPPSAIDEELLEWAL